MRQNFSSILLFLFSFYFFFISVSCDFCTSCIKAPVLCNSIGIQVNNFNKTLYYCNKCNHNNIEKINLYCNLCENIDSCHIDTGCFHCSSCS